MSSGRDRLTHFGFREVPEHSKAGLVARVFDGVADRYDLMNDLMSFGAHRLWKRMLLLRSGVRSGDAVLDVAAGSGDLAALFAPRVGDRGHVVLVDINEAMLERGRQRLCDRGLTGNVDYVRADAENLPFRERSFDCVSIGFGLRNVTRIDRALASMYRVLRPGGRLLILEFSKPTGSALNKLYDLYSFSVLPRLGRVVADNEDAYRYLAESIRRHPPQPRLGGMLEAAGFERVSWLNLAGGVVALHTGLRF